MKGNGFGLTNPPIESISPMDYSVKISSQKHKGKGARIYFFLNSQTLCATRYLSTEMYSNRRSAISCAVFDLIGKPCGNFVRYSVINLNDDGLLKKISFLL